MQHSNYPTYNGFSHLLSLPRAPAFLILSNFSLRISWYVACRWRDRVVPYSSDVSLFADCGRSELRKDCLSVFKVQYMNINYRNIPKMKMAHSELVQGWFGDSLIVESSPSIPVENIEGQ